MANGTRAFHWLTFSDIHLRTAIHLAADAVELEKQAAEERDRWSPVIHEAMVWGRVRVEYRAYCVSSLFSTVAFLEATINELVAAACDERARIAQLPPPRVAGRVADRVRDLRALRGYGTWARTLEKYQWVLTVADCSPLDKGRSPYQDVQLAVGLRNDLVHFEPRWQEHGDDPLSHERGFESLGIRTPLTGPDDNLYPRSVLCSEMARWACRSALDFADEFFGQLGAKTPVPNFVREELQDLIDGGGP